MLAVTPIKTRHRISLNLPPESQHVASLGGELDMIVVYKTRNVAGLVRAFEMAGKLSAILHDLDVLRGTSRIVDVVGIDRPFP